MKPRLRSRHRWSIVSAQNSAKATQESNLLENGEPKDEDGHIDDEETRLGRLVMEKQHPCTHPYGTADQCYGENRSLWDSPPAADSPCFIDTGQ